MKKGYLHYSENLKNQRTHTSDEERKNIASKRFDRVFCDFDEYTVDIPENRLIKKSLIIQFPDTQNNNRETDAK